MALPLAYGFLPMQDALSMNWAQSQGPLPGDLASLIDANAQRQSAQARYSAQPFAADFLRRFGGAVDAAQSSPNVPQADPLAARLAMVNAMQADQGVGTNLMPGMAPGGEDLAQYSGSLSQQPWFDELIAAGRAGADLPMMQAMNSRGLTDAERAGIQQRRQERLSGTLPMAERRAMVRDKAIAQSEQRRARTGDLSPNQQYLNEIGRFSQGQGGQGGSFLDAVLFGPEYAANMAAVNQRDLADNRKWAFATSPQGMVAGSIASGNPMSLDAIRQLMGGPPSVESLVQASGGDWEKFKTMANAFGLTGPETLDAWARVTGEQRGGPAKPDILDILSELSPAGWTWNPY